MSGRWELGMSPYQHGVRLRMGLAGRPPTLMDFCMGHEASIYCPILMAVIAHLRLVSEDASAKDIDARFPWTGTRPDMSLHLDSLLKGAGTVKQ